MPDLDHREMDPPFLREVHAWQIAGYVGVWDLRLAIPNFTTVPEATRHSLEHFLNHVLLGKPVQSVLGETECSDSTPAVLLVSPMGCDTGLYVVTTVADFDTMARLLRVAFRSALNAESVPLANEVECGWAERHSLPGAKNGARYLLDRFGDWRNSVLFPHGSLAPTDSGNGAHRE